MDLETMIGIDDALRPQSTFDYKKGWASKPYDFPNSYIAESFPVKTWDPIDTYSDDHNARFNQRYLGKNNSK